MREKPVKIRLNGFNRLGRACKTFSPRKPLSV
jgi:hypothetical protein